MKKEKNISTEETTEKKENANKFQISSQAVIIMLTILIFILLIYIVFSRYIDKRNLELKDSYLNISTETITDTQSTESILININTDDLFELTLIDGIGQAKAQAIIDYRKENGDFITIEEIRNVSGIGDALFEKIRNQIYVEVPEE